LFFLFESRNESIRLLKAFIDKELNEADNQSTLF